MNLMEMADEFSIQALAFASPKAPEQVKTPRKRER
jgi:hypothetical protein